MWEWFENIRKALRVSRELNSKEKGEAQDIGIKLKVLSKIDFLKEFSSITKEEMDNAGKLIRPNPRVPIIRKDGERKPVLSALVKILEINHNLPGKDLKAWVQSIKI